MPGWSAVTGVGAFWVWVTCVNMSPCHGIPRLVLAGRHAGFSDRPIVDSLSAALAMTPADIAILPLGRGSNLLLPDTGFDGMVIDLGDLKELAY